MKLTNNKGNKDTIRGVWTNENEFIGIIGMIEDLLKEGVFESTDCPKEKWAFIPEITTKIKIADTRNELLRKIKES